MQRGRTEKKRKKNESDEALKGSHHAVKKKEKKPKGKEKGGERIVMREGKNWEFTKTKLEQRRDRGRELKKKKMKKEQ